MALSFHPTTATVFGHGLPTPDAADMTSFLHDVHPEVCDALLGFVDDPLDPSSNAALDDLLRIPNAAAGFTGPIVDDVAAFLGPIKDDAKVDQHCDKKLRTAYTDDARYGLTVTYPSQQWYGGGGNQQVSEFLTEFVQPLPLPPPLPQQQPLAFVHGSDEKKPGGKGCHQSVHSAAARHRRERISQKTAELSRLIPGGHRLSTADMLQEAARHVKLLQAQVGMLALMHTVGSSEKGKIPITAAQEQMHALLVCGSVQERLAAEGKCLVPRKLVDAVAKDKAVKSNPLVSRDLGRFIASLEQ